MSVFRFEQVINPMNLNFYQIISSRSAGFVPFHLFEGRPAEAPARLLPQFLKISQYYFHYFSYLYFEETVGFLA